MSIENLRAVLILPKPIEYYKCEYHFQYLFHVCSRKTKKAVFLNIKLACMLLVFRKRNNLFLKGRLFWVSTYSVCIILL